MIFVFATLVLPSRERSGRQNDNLLALELLQVCQNWRDDSAYVWCVDVEVDESVRRSTTNSSVFSEGLGVNLGQLYTKENTNTIAALLHSFELKSSQCVASITPGTPKYFLWIDTNNSTEILQFHGNLAVSYIATDSGYLRVEFTLDVDALSASKLN